MGAPKNLGADPSSHFDTPGRHFGFCRRCRHRASAPGVARPVCKKIFMQAFYVKILILFVLSPLCYIIEISAMTQRDNINYQLFPTLLISVVSTIVQH